MERPVIKPGPHEEPPAHKFSLLFEFIYEEGNKIKNTRQPYTQL